MFDKKLIVNIFLVDDCFENFMLFCVIFEWFDYNFVMVCFGKDVFEMVFKYCFLVVLIDIVMFIMNGFEVVIYLKEFRWSCDIFIIFVMVFGNDLEEIYCVYVVGGVDYLVKLFDFEIVCKKVVVFVEFVCC